MRTRGQGKGPEGRGEEGRDKGREVKENGDRPPTIFGLKVALVMHTSKNFEGARGRLCS